MRAFVLCSVLVIALIADAVVAALVHQEHTLRDAEPVARVCTQCTIFTDCQDVLTLSAARDTARARNFTNCPTATVTVLRDVEVTETLQLTQAVRGTQWTANGTAAIIGGVRLNASGWTEVSPSERCDRGLPRTPTGTTLLRYSLTDVNLTSAGFGKYHNGGLGQCVQTRAELVIAGVPMTVARYPNAPLMPGEPWMQWSHVSEVGKASSVDDGLVDCPTNDAADARRWALDNGGRNCRLSSTATASTLEAHQFAVSDMPADVAARIAATPLSELQQGWAHGFWAFDWADNYIQLANATVGGPKGANLTISYNPKTPPVYRMVPKARFYVTNLKSELDQPGEYWFDEAANAVYLVVDDSDTSYDPRVQQTIVTTTSGSVIEVTEAATNIQIEGLTILGSRGGGISVRGAGTLNITIADVTIQTTGLGAIGIDGGASASTVTGSNIRFAGCRAVSVSGGDSATLASGGLVVANNVIERYARWTRTYNPGVSFGGVGAVVTANAIGHAPHNGLQGGGNNHLFARNALHNLCYEVRDSGSFYVGRSWVHRGMVLQDNTFTDIVAIEPTFLGSDSVQAIYLDDQQSGVTVVNNTCSNVHVCMLIGGGRDNTISGNRCGSFQKECIAFDDRGLNWQRAMCTGDGLLVQQLHQVHYQSPPYSTEYPRIVNTLSDRPCTPVGNAFVDNYCCGCNQTRPFMSVAASTVQAWGSSESGTIYDC